MQFLDINDMTEKYFSSVGKYWRSRCGTMRSAVSWEPPGHGFHAQPGTVALGIQHCCIYGLGQDCSSGVPVMAQWLTNLTRNHEVRVRSLPLLSGLSCCELWCRLQMWLGSLCFCGSGVGRQLQLRLDP